MPGKLKISKRCCSHLGELQQILNAKGAQRKRLLQNCSNGCVHAIGEALQNIINKKVDLTPSQLGKLRAKEDDVWKFLAKGKSVAGKRRILVQDGGFLGLIGPFMRMAAPLLGNIVKPLIGTLKPLLGPLLGGLGLGGDRR